MIRAMYAAAEFWAMIATAGELDHSLEEGDPQGMIGRVFEIPAFVDLTNTYTVEETEDQGTFKIGVDYGDRIETMMGTYPKSLLISCLDECNFVVEWLREHVPLIPKEG